MSHTNKIAVGLLIALLAGCEANESSKTKDAWNATNDPVKMVATAEGFVTKYSILPKNGQPGTLPWSDNYWPTYQGGVAYRWNDADSQKLHALELESTDSTYRGQLDNNPQLQELRSKVYGYSPYTKEQILAMPEEQRAALIQTLSPAEKYDIYRGDWTFPTVQAERERTNILQTLRDRSEYDPETKIETWWGICHAWAPATILFKEPGALSVQSKDNIKVDFGASDIKALITHMVDYNPEQSNFRTQMGARCNSNISPSNLSKLDKEIFGSLEAKNNEKVEASITLLLKERSIEIPVKIVFLAYVLNYSDSAEYAQKRFNEIKTDFAGRISGSVMRADFNAAVEKADKVLAKVGTTIPSPSERQAGLLDATRTSACTDTNAGAFHLVLTNVVGIRKESFVIDMTRDYEVWNQAVAKYDSREIATYTGSKISAEAAPGTVKEVQVETILRYTGEMNPMWEPFGDGSAIDTRYHKPLRYRYRLELDERGHIIGGSWVSDSRPDFIWGASNFKWSSEWTDLKKLYLMARKNR
ncbi:MAG: hypothetical protein M3Q07_19470 [Pseudobdellovibrionaceae bacterium]|nr:hypothetical protein [Pseudobdellovibrionaceae bacterium]